MPIFEYNGNKVNVNDDQVNEFAKYHPDAITRIERDGKVYGVRPGDMDAFNARFTNNQEGEQASQIYYQPQATTESAENKDTGSFIGDIGERFLSGAASATGSAFNLLDKGASAINRWTGSEGGFFKEASNYMKGLAEYTRNKSDRYQGKGFTDLVKEGDYSGALGSAVLDATESAPLSLGIMATGGAGLVGAGVLSASDKYDQLKQENPEMPAFNRYANSILTGAAESLSEVFGAGTLGKVVKSTLKAGGKKAAADLVKKNFLDKLASFESKHWITMPILAEGSEEAANALAEYVVDNATGVKRDDNIFETMINAAVPGAMGGAQFVPMVGAGKAYGWNKKRKVTNAYSDASKGIEGIFNEQEKAQFDETIHRFQQNGNINDINMFLFNVYSAKGLSENQRKAVLDYTNASMSYNNYVSYVNDRINDEVKRRMEDIDGNINEDMGTVMQAVVNGDTENPVFVTKGKLYSGEMDDNMNPTIDYDKSDDVIYYRDKDGKIQQCDVKNVSYIENEKTRANLYAEIMDEVRGQVISEEENDINFAPGDEVVLPDGNTGTIQSKMEDGSYTVVSNGMTNQFTADQLGKPDEQAEPVPEITADERAATRMDYPTKDGKIDFDNINDPQMFHDGLLVEFKDDAESSVDEFIANLDKELKNAGNMKDPIKKRRKIAEINQKLDFFNQVKSQFQPKENTTETVESAEAPVEQDMGDITEQPVGTNDVQPEQYVAKTENSSSEESVSATPYEDRPVDDTIYDLLDGQMDIDEVNQFVEANKKASDKALKEIEGKKPQVGTDRAEYLRQKSAWQALMDDARRKSDYWTEVKNGLDKGSITEAEQNTLNAYDKQVPLNAHELAARALANGSIKLLREDYQRETGGGNAEANKMFGIFASEQKGGVGIERAGEILTQMDHEAGTNFLDPDDPNAARDVIIDVLSQARTRGDLINYIRDQRQAQQRREEEAAYNDFAKYTTEAYGMTPEEYQAYEESSQRDFANMPEEAIRTIDGEIYDDIKREQEEYEYVQQQLNNNNSNDNGGVQERGEGGGSILREEQPVEVSAGDRGIESERRAGQDGYNQDEPAQEEAGGTEEEQVNRLSDEEISTIIDEMENLATDKPSVEYSKEEWDKRFKNPIETPVGRVRMGEHQFGKLHPDGNNNHQDRRSWIGIIYNTLTSPNIIVEQYDNVDGAERDYKYVFVKSFLTSSGESVTYFTSVTVKKGDMEVVITNHFKKYKDIRKLLKEGKLCFSSISPSGIQTEPNRASASVTTSETDNNPGVSENKNSIPTANKQAKQTELSENVLSSSDAEFKDSQRIAESEQEVDVNPTDAQKEAGNYKKGHLKLKGFDITIENPAGSVRSGVDRNGSRWENRMNNTYGYFKGTQGVDGDHIDVYLSNDMDNWSGDNVYVIDQYNPDGSFDEHKVMFGFDNKDEALSNFLANYSQGWGDSRKLDVTPISMDGFKEWVDSSHRKTKPFASYKAVKALTEEVDQKRTNIREDGTLIDESGNPLTLYHGTPDASLSIDRLEAGHARLGEDEPARFNGDGISFTPNESVALDYSDGGKGKVLKANIVLRNPWYTVGNSNMSNDEARSFTDRLKREGYDGIINYSSQPMREIGALPAEVIVFDRSSLRPVEDVAKEPAVESSEPITGTERSPYAITPYKYTTQKGKVLDMRLVSFDAPLTDEQKKIANKIAKEDKGWFDRKSSGYLMRSEDSARGLAEAVVKANNPDISKEDYNKDNQQDKNVSESRDNLIPDNSKAKSEETPTGNSKYSDDAYDEWTNGIKYEDAKFPAGISDENKVEKKQKAGNKTDGVSVKVAFNGNDLHVQIKTLHKSNDKEIVFKDATKYGASDITYVIDRGIGTTNDGARLAGDAILELYGKRKLRRGSSFYRPITSPFIDEDAKPNNSPKSPIVEDGTTFKNNIAGGNAVARVVGSTIENGERKYLVRYATGLEEMDAKLLAGEETLPEDELRQRIEDGRFGTMDSQESKEKNEKPKERPKEKIEDVGEKIGGARKDIIRATADRIDINGETFSKIFPKFDFKKLIQSGLDPKLASGLKFIYDHSKESFKSKKRSRGEIAALNETRFIANYTKGYLLGDTSVDYSDKGWVFTTYGKELYQFNTELYNKLHEVLGDDMFDIDLGKYFIDVVPDSDGSKGKSSAVFYRDGKPIDVKYIVKVGDTKLFTKDEHDDAVKLFLDKVKSSVNYKKANPYKLLVYYFPRKKGSYYIGTKIGGKVVALTPEGNEYNYSYIDEHRAELQAAAERMASEMKDNAKSGENKKWKPEMNLGNMRDRVGMDYREGRSVSAKELMDKFGFRGIEFGNYVTQKERQQYLNECYDAFLDMADILGISPKAISIDGKLALAVGARGTGKAIAHYEPSKHVINLTKVKSAGTLAHEWWHAMDFHFGRKSSPAPSTDYRYDEDTRVEVRKSIESLMGKIQDSDYYKRSRLLDNRIGGKDYYSTNTELAARAFQDYITKRLIDKGQINDFLSHYTLAGDWNGEMETYPYPIESEADWIRASFDNLFSIIEEKEIDGNTVLYQKADIARRVSEDEANLRDALVDRLRQSGIDVIDNAEEGQKVLEEANAPARMQAKRRLLDTAPLIQEEGSSADISSSDGAKILRNLDDLASLLENVSSWRKSILSDIANALGAKSKGSGSRYATFKTKKGVDVTIRLGSHNANTASFDNNNEANGISIVISNRANNGIKNYGNAHLVEFFYPEIALRRADGKPLAEIVRSIKQALYSGEFNDPTGIAERQEVNAGTRFFRTPSGEAYGYTVNGKIYIDPRIATSETPIHEYAHLWASALRSSNQEEWKNVVDLMKGTPVWEEVRRSYPELTTDDEIADEVLAQYSGRRGAEKLREAMKKASETKGGLIEKANAIAAIQNVKDALNRFWRKVADFFGVHFTTAEEVADKVLSDLLNGVNPTALATKKRQLDKINKENPMLDDYHTGIRSIDDILTFREAVEQARREGNEGGWETLSAYPDVSNETLERAIESGKITVYSSHPITDGVFITPSRMQAEEYAGGGRVYQKEVNVDDVAWITTDEGQLAKVKGDKLPLRLQKDQEIDEIISRAKAEGTYMKAPNGKPSNLTPRQWAQVRTKAFKDWFGDWEKSARIEKLRNSDSVSIKGDEIEITDDYKQNKRNALEYGKRLRATYVNKDTGVSITLGKSGVKEVLNHDYKNKEQIQSIAAIPQIIENSIYIESANNEDTDVNKDVSRYHYYVCGLNIGGVDYTVRAVIAEQSNGDRYYDHKLTRIEKGKLLDSLSGIPTPGFNQRISLVSDSKDKRLSSILQTNSSKVVDENGEPMVVYHGTDKDITSFEMNDGSMGRGVYFTSNWDEAAEYAMDKQGIDNIDDVDESKIYECFVDVRDDNQITHSRFSSEDIEVLVTDPTQIKSATDNVGAFDGANPDIRYREGDNLDDIESVNERFNERLDELVDNPNQKDRILHLGNSSKFLQEGGISDAEIILEYDKLVRKSVESYKNRHPYSIEDIKDLPKAISSPIAVFVNTNGNNDHVILTELKKDGKNFIVAIKTSRQNRKGGVVLTVNEIVTLFPKDEKGIINWINTGKATNIDKEKALRFIEALPNHPGTTITNEELDSATKVVKDFVNPTLYDGNIEEESALLRPVTDEETLDRLNNEETIKVYRAMQVIDGKLYPPMSAKVGGKLREPINIDEWEEAEERPELATEDGKFVLNKGNGSSLKAAYNPYIHTSRSPLNDQFSSAQDRDNLVVVEVEIPKSELTSGYKAYKAKDPVGEMTWHSGPVSSKLKGEKARKVILTRWDKPVRIVPDSEVARRIAKLLEGEDIIMPSNVVTPSLRAELEKLGVPFIETDNRGKPILNREGEGSVYDTTYRQRMRDEAENMGRALGVEVEIVDDGSTLPGKKGKAKGFFDRATKKVTVVVGNHKSIGDIQATVLHEVVGHYGLRGLLGERFDDMMDMVYRTIDKATRKRIAEAAVRNYRGDVRIATEEYLASVAERGVDRPGVWSRIKSAIKAFFRSMGIDLRMSDEDIAYLLWKSKNRLMDGDSVPTIIDKVAKDQEMREGLLYRDGLGFGSLLHTPKKDRKGLSDIAHDIMGKIRNGNPFTHENFIRLQEGYQDRLIRLKEFQDKVAKETGHDVKDFEDMYTFENQAHSRAQQDIEDFLKDAMESVWKIHDEIARTINKPAGENIREIETYLMARHGLERNAEMRKREIDALRKSGANPSQDDIDKINAKDFSGLTAISEEITGNPGMDEKACEKYAKDFESKHDTDKLWKAINKATGSTLDKLLETGQITKELYSQIKGMYKYYIPLKEWDGVRATDMYDYVEPDQDIVSNPLKQAKGRKTRAGNVLANIASDYESATMLGYKNLCKLRLLNLARNSGTSELSVSEQWYTKGYDANGNEIWEPASATGFTEDAAHNAQVIQDFNDNMRALQKSGDALLHKDVLRLGVPVKKWQEKQHTVRVKEAGREILIYFNGDPRVAQAINGQNNVKLDNAILRVANRLRKWMMLNYTARNINFILRNFARDFFYVNTMNFVKYGAAFEAKYIANFPKAFAEICAVEFKGRKVPEYESFRKNGGMTGYVEVMGYDRYKNEIERLVKRSEGRNFHVRDIFHAIGSYIERFNSVIENCSRYTVYKTAKQTGMSELKAIEAAKEASVNFNRRGSGQMGAVWAQNAYFFFNASIQGTENFMSAANKNRARAAMALGFWVAFGYTMRMIGAALSGDDDDSYDNLPDYVRQNNIVLYVPGTGNKYIMLPLPVELRAIFGLGDMLGQASLGQYKGRDFAGDLALKLTDLLPKSVEFPDRKRNDDESVVESVAKNLSPDAIRPLLDAYWFNENYFGKRVTGRNAYNKHVPEWQKVSYGTSKTIINASRMMNELTGGDYATKGWSDSMLTNPSALEYLFEQYLGGVGKVLTQSYKSVEGVVNGDLALRNIPVLSGLTYSTENMIPRNYTNERYRSYIDEYEETASRMRKYKEGMMEGEDLSDEFNGFTNSDAFRRYMLIGMFKKQIDGLYDMAKTVGSDSEEAKNLNRYARELKGQMINEIDKLDENEK